MNNDPTTVNRVLSEIRDRADEFEQMMNLTERLTPKWREVQESRSLSEDEREVIQLVRDRLESLLSDTRRDVETELKGIDVSPATPQKSPERVAVQALPISAAYLAATQLHPAKVQAARAQGAYLATARRATLSPASYLGEISPYLAVGGVAISPITAAEEERPPTRISDEARDKIQRLARIQKTIRNLDSITD